MCDSPGDEGLECRYIVSWDGEYSNCAIVQHISYNRRTVMYKVSGSCENRNATRFCLSFMQEVN